MPKFIVEGYYESDTQITSDVVVASSEEEATAMVVKVRLLHGNAVGDGWYHDRTVALAEELAHLQKLADESDEKTTADWEYTVYKSLNMTDCTLCGKLMDEDDNYGLVDPLCETCAGEVEEIGIAQEIAAQEAELREEL